MTKPRLGFIGLGTMGMPIAWHLMDIGYPLDIWVRTPTKVAERWCNPVRHTCSDGGGVQHSFALRL
jgi:3-hydroxyisobutyrate dehydrogenase-like beta-hydroxyacid dehydrogenase